MWKKYCNAAKRGPEKNGISKRTSGKTDTEMNLLCRALARDARSLQQGRLNEEPDTSRDAQFDFGGGGVSGGGVSGPIQAKAKVLKETYEMMMLIMMYHLMCLRMRYRLHLNRNLLVKMIPYR